MYFPVLIKNLFFDEILGSDFMETTLEEDNADGIQCSILEVLYF